MSYTVTIIDSRGHSGTKSFFSMEEVMKYIKQIADEEMSQLDNRMITIQVINHAKK